MAISPIILMFAASAASPASTPASVDALDRVRCVREAVTGSLVSSRKVCHTEREWRRIRGDAEGEARRMTQPGTLNDNNGR